MKIGLKDFDFSLKLLSLIAVIVLASLFALVLLQNQLIDTDYSFHLHEIWALYKGYIPSSPFLGGGSHFLFKYGAPIDLLGTLIYPVTGVYTVGILLGASIPPFWYFSEKVFSFFTDHRTARLAALAAILNPLFLYYLTTAKLPLLWGFVFFLASIYFYLEERSLLAVLFGALGVVTHPLSIFLPLSLLLLNPEFKRWAKIYFIPLAIFFLQTTAFFGLFQGIFSSHSLQLWILAIDAGVLAMALALSFKLKEKSRMLSGLALLILVIWIIGGINGIWIPAKYFNRLGFQVFLILMPFLLVKVRQFENTKAFAALTVFSMLALSATTVGCAKFMEDSPQAFQKNHENIGEIVGENYVHYAGDGSALFELPRLENIKFSNSGRAPFTSLPENKYEYEKSLLRENAIFVLFYGSNLRENMIKSLGYPVVYSHDNITLYRLPQNPQNR